MMADQGRNTATHQTSYSYDVFLSFRGEDTRDSFTGYLYQALSRRGLNIFLDDEGLKGGDQIKRSLVNAIQRSRASIVVLSKNYASSSWCLDELVEILDCMGLKKQLVWPIFYKVAPSDVRHQRKSYAKAMAKHEEKLGDGSDKVQKWRSALSEVASLKGWHYKTGYESKFIDEIVKKATTKLQREQFDVGEHIIGHQSRIEKVKSLLDIESHQSVCMLGIHGIGGMGKTTLAKALYNSIYHQFEYAIFLEDVREKSNSYMGLVRLQEAILSKFEGENIKLSSASEGVTRLKDIFQHQRVLLVLDDVDKEDQLENLARKCDWFGLGSRIIITTRDKHVLDIHDVEKRFEMKGLSDDEALQLFCLKAFKESQPPLNYEKVSNCVVEYASGLPLALKVIGSHLATKSVKGCEDALKQYEKIPDEKIQKILRISYECLEDPAKCIFLDIACFFKGKRLDYVEQVWEKCDFFPSYNVGILEEKSLITIENGELLRMHDLIQDMGKEIVRLEDPKNLGRRSRLYFHEDIVKVLRDNLGSDQIEGIMLDPPEEEEVNWNNNAFKKMHNLRILIIRRMHFTQELDYLPSSLKLLDWEGYPSKSLPLGFDHSDIVVLSLPCSHLTLEKTKPFPKMVHLTQVNFSWCQYITHFPDVSGVPNLSELNLRECLNLTAIHHSVGFLKKLKRLYAYDCDKLQDFPRRIYLPSLQDLDISGTSIEFFPRIEKRMRAQLRIGLGWTRITKLPDSISNLEGLEFLFIDSGSFTVGGLPSELFMLPNIMHFQLDDCVAVGESLRRLQNSHAMATTGPSTSKKPRSSPLRSLRCFNCGLTDEDLHIILSYFPNLQKLVVRRNEFVSLPARIKESDELKILDVSNCRKLEEIPELPTSVIEASVFACPRLSSSEVFKKLWSQASNEVYGLEAIEPRLIEIPDWFDHHGEGGIVSFWARRKFPVLAIAFFLERFAYMKKIHLRIRGDLYGSASGHPVRSNKVSIAHLRHLFSGLRCSSPEPFIGHEWNHVEIEIECEVEWLNGRRRDISNNVSSWGAYVYKQATNMGDIRFTRPSSLKRTLLIVDDDDSPKRKRVRKLKPNNKGKDKLYRKSTKFLTPSSGRTMKKI